MGTSVFQVSVSDQDMQNRTFTMSSTPGSGLSYFTLDQSSKQWGVGGGGEGVTIVLSFFGFTLVRSSVHSRLTSSIERSLVKWYGRVFVV